MRQISKGLGVCIVEYLFNAPASCNGWFETIRYILSESLMKNISVAMAFGSTCGGAFLRDTRRWYSAILVSCTAGD